MKYPVVAFRRVVGRSTPAWCRTPCLGPTALPTAALPLLMSHDRPRHAVDGWQLCRQFCVSPPDKSVCRKLSNQRNTQLPPISVCRTLGPHLAYVSEASIAEGTNPPKRFSGDVNVGHRMRTHQASPCFSSLQELEEDAEPRQQNEMRGFIGDCAGLRPESV